MGRRKASKKTEREGGKKFKTKKDKKTKTKSKNGEKETCPDCKCPLSEMLPYISKYTKVQNALRKLKRTVAWWKLLEEKANKANEGAFNSAYENYKLCTNDGTTCRVGNPNTTLLGFLADCSTISNGSSTSSAYKTCDKTTFPVILEDPCGGCKKDSGSATPGNTCNADKDCSPKVTKNTTNADGSTTIEEERCDIKVTTTITSGTPGSCTLDDAVIKYMDEKCIPFLNEWSKKYRDCYSTKTNPNCVAKCQTEANAYTCQQKECQNCPDNSCTFENCLVSANGNSTDKIDCQCNCFKTLDDITTPKKYEGCGSSNSSNCIDCFKMIGFERLMKKKRDFCLNAPSEPYLGNFGDCRQRERETFTPLRLCCGGGTVSTKAPTSSRMAKRNFDNLMFQRNSF